MKEVLDDIERWRDGGHRVAVARVVALEGSGPRDPGATMVVNDAGEVAGSVSGGCVEGAVVEAALEVLGGTRDALGELDAGLTSVRHYGEHGEAREDTVSVFIESFSPPPRMVIFGAVDFTAALAKVAKVLGYHVVVCDARPVFATVIRFPMADEVVNDWPDRYLEKIGDELGPRDAVCVLTHDTKFDVPAIVGALPADVGYPGARGSRRTHPQRLR